MIGIFLKAPKFVVSEILGRPAKLISHRAVKANRYGTVVILFSLFALLAAYCSLVTLEATEGKIATQSDGRKWLSFVFITLAMTTVITMFVGGILATLREGREMLSDFLVAIGSFPTKIIPKKKGGEGSKSFFYKAGQDFTKGATESIPGDEWKYPKDDTDEEGGDDDTPDSSHKNRWN